MIAEPSIWDLVRGALSERIGLHFPPERVSELRRALAPAVAELGFRDVEECAGELVAGRLDDAQIEVLASHLTIGETYFMRGDETFAALRSHVLPDLIAAARREGRRSLRIWSAGCCSGEEAYSLAILVREMLPDHASWDVEILATDVNPRFLAKASAGVYGEWSFRGTPASFRKRWFSRTADGRFALADAVRAMVRFAALNLVDARARNRFALAGAFDLVLCRNVLMYFTQSQAARVVGGFHRALRPRGWLIVAPCEISQPLFSRFESVGFDGAIFYRRGESSAGRDASMRVQPGVTATRPTSGRSAEPRLPPQPASPVPPSNLHKLPQPFPAPRPSPAPDPAVLERRARALADQGRLDEALVWCDRWLAGSKLDAGAHYLRAAILMEAERLDEARVSLQRCLYLEPGDAMATFALGNLERRLGQPESARQQYRNTLDLLRRHAPAEELAHGGGITVAQLDSLVSNLLQEARRA